MPATLETEATTFLHSYASLFSSPDASSSHKVAELAIKISKNYRRGCTFFTNGQISRFQTQEEAADLIEREMRNNIKAGSGTFLLLESSNVASYSETAATVHVTWEARSANHPDAWRFINIYGYRAATEDQPAGWEYVVRDNEVNEMFKATGRTFV